MSAAFKKASELLPAWRHDVLHGEAPELWSAGDAWRSFELGPGLLSILGGAPGAGKTALSMQLVVDMLRNNSELSAYAANAEMSPGALLDRQLARLAGISATRVRQRWKMSGAEVERGLAEVEAISERLAFHTGEPTLKSVAGGVEATDSRLVILDYIQRFRVNSEAKSEKRIELEGLMELLRRFCEAGCGVLVLSAVARQSGSKGSTYNGLNMASFRGSSELEFAADSAWLLYQSKADSEGESKSFGMPGERMTLQCCKNRHGETPMLPVRFNKIIQGFTVEGSTGGVYAETPGSGLEVISSRADVEPFDEYVEEFDNDDTLI